LNAHSAEGAYRLFRPTIFIGACLFAMSGAVVAGSIAENLYGAWFTLLAAEIPREAATTSNCWAIPGIRLENYWNTLA